MPKLFPWVRAIVLGESPDVILITGDIFETMFESMAGINPYEELTKLLGDDIPIICTMGNHEFMYRTIEETHDFYTENYNPDKYNVHYLDIVGHYDVDHVHFFGNVLWYDGTLSTVGNQNLKTFADGCWADVVIENFDYLFEHGKCLRQLKENMNTDLPASILATHCVPHRKLNGHMVKTMSPFNAFSGVENLFATLSSDLSASCGIDWAVSGHTHWRMAGDVINGCFCVNVGNDYQPPFQHFIIDI
jgi:hypothetical protein